jgi:hypothetical protein
MNKRALVILIIAFFILGGAVAYNRFFKDLSKGTTEQNLGELVNEPNPLSIEYMRKQEYPGSEIVIEQTLPAGSNYDRYIASYKSDGLKIYGLLTVPQGDPSTDSTGTSTELSRTSSPQASSGLKRPEGGWPVIIFNHGYIQPEQYRAEEKYVAYTDAFSRNGYIVFKPDFRGHGNSEGNPEGAYYSPAYTVDVLNAVSSIKKYKDPSIGSGVVADPNRIGMWGHSMEGMITKVNGSHRGY